MSRRTATLSMIAVMAFSVIGVILLIVTTPEATREGRFLVLPYGWLRVLAGFVFVTGGISLSTYLYGLATRPGKAGQYALTAGTHLFIWGVILLVFYPVIYLLGVSFNRNNALASALPREGNLLVRAGIIPNPADFSFVQYRTLLEQTHILSYQWLLIGVLAVALIVVIGLALTRRFGQESYRLERWQRWAGWLTFLSAGALILTITPEQFYSVTQGGERIPADSEGALLLYIRNTLLVSGTTGLFAVLISTTAGYAFARMTFEGRYQTLLTFIFVQMFPGFMALVAIYYLMSYLELLNFVGLILAYSGGAIAFASWIFKGYLESISPSLEEAAMIDGATRFGAFWRVILPISIPMLLFIFLLQFIGTYSEFILANTLLSGNDEQWTVGMFLRRLSTGRFDTQWGTLAASAVLGSLPILVIFYAFQDALTGQYQAGGVKG